MRNTRRTRKELGVAVVDIWRRRGWAWRATSSAEGRSEKSPHRAWRRMICSRIGVRVDSAKHAKVIGVDITLSTRTKGTIKGAIIRRFRTGERLVTCRAFCNGADFETMRLRVADDNGVVVAAAEVSRRWSQRAMRGKVTMTYRTISRPSWGW